MFCRLAGSQAKAMALHSKHTNTTETHKQGRLFCIDQRQGWFPHMFSRPVFELMTPGGPIFPTGADMKLGIVGVHENFTILAEALVPIEQSPTLTAYCVIQVLFLL